MKTEDKIAEQTLAKALGLPKALLFDKEPTTARLRSMAARVVRVGQNSGPGAIARELDALADELDDA